MPAAVLTGPDSLEEHPTGTTDRARRAVSACFVLNGLAFSSWVARTPGVRDRLRLSDAHLGLLLLCLSVGALATLPLAGPLVQRLAPARAVLLGCAGVVGGLLCAAGGLALRNVALTGLGLLLTGTGNAGWDVAMNVEGAEVERRAGRSLMPRLHAGFSLGTIVGAGVGSAAAAAQVGVATQLAVTAPVVGVAVILAVRAFLPVPTTRAADAGVAAGRGRERARSVWTEPRTLAIGFLVLAFALTEGIANDWLALAVRDGHGASEAVGAATYGVFVTAMTIARTTGGTFLARFGRPLVLRATAGCGVLGLLLVVLGPGTAWAVPGALLWGAGASLGFPVGMSAAADDPAAAALRVSVVSSIGYTAFLAGPPLVGFLASQVGILDALLVVPVALAAGALLAGAARPPRRAD